MAHGASMGISRDVSALLDELAEVKPTLLYAVPQLFKRVCDAIHAKVWCCSGFFFVCVLWSLRALFCGVASGVSEGDSLVACPVYVALDWGRYLSFA